jgi:hypothetical protein
VAGGDVGPVLVPEQVLEENLQAEGESVRSFYGVQPEDLVLLARDLKGRLAAEAVRRHRLLSLLARISAVPALLPNLQYLDIKLLTEGTVK